MKERLNPSKIAIVVNDFRIVPILAALSLRKAHPGATLIASEETVRFGDYADRVTGLKRHLTAATLRRFAGLRVVGASPEKVDHSACKGCRSSFSSFLRDAEAPPESDHMLWSRINSICQGSRGVRDFIERSKFSKVFVFNGRVASARVICISARKSVGIGIYEYGRKASSGYRILQYPVHDREFQSSLLKSWSQIAKGPIDRKEARKFVSTKLRNPFSKKQVTRAQKKYETVVFFSSPHEARWTNDSDSIPTDGAPLRLAHIALADPRFREPAAFRLHPNMVGSGDERQQVERLTRATSGRAIDLYPPSNPISSHSLIAQSEQVMVGGSSIALDSFFLGRRPIFLSENAYRGVLESANPADPTEEEILRVAWLVSTFESSRLVAFSLAEASAVSLDYWSRKVLGRVSRLVRRQP